MAIEVASERALCSRCGKMYSRVKGYFASCYAALYKGRRSLHICKECVDNLYDTYLAQCGSAKDAVRQMCRKLDLFWSEKIFDEVEKKNTPHTMMTQYLRKLTGSTYAGKCYDDTLSAEGTLWNFGQPSSQPIITQDIPKIIQADANKSEAKTDDTQNDIPNEYIEFWGTGYTLDMYEELERKRAYYMSKYLKGTEIDMGTEVLIRQICNLEVSISRDTSAGKSIDKSVNSLNTLLGSLNMKPAQKKDDDVDAKLAETPMGVWLYRFEKKRPLPEIDESLKDVNHVKKYIMTWMGHLCKLVGLKNGFTKLYEDEMERLRVEKPEYADEDDEDMLIDIFSEGDGDAGD